MYKCNCANIRNHFKSTHVCWYQHSSKSNENYRLCKDFKQQLSVQYSARPRWQETNTACTRAHFLARMPFHDELIVVVASGLARAFACSVTAFIWKRLMTIKNARNGVSIYLFTYILVTGCSPKRFTSLSTIRRRLVESLTVSNLCTVMRFSTTTKNLRSLRVSMRDTLGWIFASRC